MEIYKQTFFTDPYLMLLAGSIFALVSGMKEEPVFQEKSFWFGAVVSVVITLLALFFYVIKPEWMFMYVIRSNEAPKWLGPSLFCLYPFPYVASYVAGAEFKKRRKKIEVLYFSFIACAAVFMHILILDRWTSWTTTEDFTRGYRGGFFTTPLWLYLGISTIITLALMFYFLYVLVKKKA